MDQLEADAITEILQDCDDPAPRLNWSDKGMCPAPRAVTSRKRILHKKGPSAKPERGAAALRKASGHCPAAGLPAGADGVGVRAPASMTP